MKDREEKPIVELPFGITLFKNLGSEGGVFLSTAGRPDFSTASDPVQVCKKLECDDVEMLIFYLQKSIANDIGFPPLNCEERIMVETMKSARSIQNFLWGESNGEWGWEEWLRMFRKRVAKLEEVDRSNPHADVEGKKRLLQVAALGVALIQVILKSGIPWDASPNAPPSNLPGYSEPIAYEDLCCWNPKHQVYTSFISKEHADGCKNRATVLVGMHKIKLCESCSNDPHFKKMKNRIPIKDEYLEKMSERIKE